MQAKGISKLDPKVNEYLGPREMRIGSGECSTMENSIFVQFTYYVVVRMIKSRRLKWAGHVAILEEGRDAFKMLIGKHTGKRPLARPGLRLEDSRPIRMDRYQ